MNNLYLIGMMGSGKSVTGKALAKKTGKKFLDLDEALETKLGLSIAEIFEKKGESFFREEEAHILTAAAKSSNQIISTGGGAVILPDNIQRMKATGKVVYLATSMEWLWKRVCDKPSRPLLKTEDPKGALEKILNSRKKIYETAADFQVVTDAKTAEQVAEDIMEQLKIK